MIGYLFLFIALFSGAIKGLCGKKISIHTNNFGDAILANIIRMVLCTVIGFALILASGNLSALIPSKEILFISALSGIATAVFVVTWLISVKKSAYMMLDIFLMLGILIPLGASSILFDEAVKSTHCIGIAMLFVAVIIMCSYNNSIKEKITLPSFFLLLISGIANGIADFSQKLFVRQVPGGSVASFNFYTYIFATFVLIITFLVAPKNVRCCKTVNFKRIIDLIFIMAICIFANSYFKTLAAERLSAVLLYPLNQGASLIFSVVMSILFFKEKLTTKGFIGIVLAFMGLIIINVL